MSKKNHNKKEIAAHYCVSAAFILGAVTLLIPNVWVSIAVTALGAFGVYHKSLGAWLAIAMGALGLVYELAMIMLS